MPFQDYVTELQHIRDDAKVSLDDAQAAVDRIVDGALNDFTGSSGIFADFDIGPPPVLITFPTPVPELIIPPFDESILNDFDPYTIFQTNLYDSEFLEDLEQQCRSIFAGSVPGFTYANVESLFSWRNERDQRDLQIALDEAAVQFGAKRGFPIPADAQVHKQNEILRRFADVQTDRTREGVTLQADKLIDAYKHALSIGVNIEEIRSKMNMAIMDGLLGKINAQVEVYKASLAGLVANFEGQIKLIITEADIAKTNGILTAQYASNTIQKTLGLRGLWFGVAKQEYQEVGTENTLKTNGAMAVMKAWSDIYGTAALGTQTNATESYAP
jgi:hypothetical protein